MGGKEYGESRDADAIIIGTGLGGLTAGAYLAKQGVRVLLFEQHRQPGGYFTTFKHLGLEQRSISREAGTPCAWAISRPP